MNIVIAFRCAKCRARLKAPYRMRGHAGACPGCAEPFVVPNAKLADEAAAFIQADDRMQHRVPPRIGS